MDIFIKHTCLEKERVDCIVVGIFDSCEFSYSADYLDKHSNHYIRSFMRFGDMTGKIGETLILYNIPNILAKRVLLVGFGKKEKITRNNFKKILNNIVDILSKKSVKNIIYSLTEIYFTHNMYWMIRTIVLCIKESLYQVPYINNVIQNSININSIILNIWDKKYLHTAQISLQHALAIDYGITCTKNISNLPPNICNPLYLSNEAKKLAKRYKNNISVEVIDIKEMKKLGMNAYVSVGEGSKNKPFMSVIKYSGKNVVNKKVIALLGKGVTFDSGGISIKPALDMDLMKYDMCGAAAVYGTLIMAAELQLPLTIIGVLSGCENMLGGGAFRPGDILTTMSGKTIEILNTDAEGRLILCDSLTYLERFSPDIVIDIATLTGACVTALGELCSGFFTNSKELANQFISASQETDDKIWQLPLFPEYYEELTSNVADLSNSGKGKAGAITAACFLANFTKKYHWAHLDIAGTAWKSGKDKGATGRPVELLCQFLLNESNYLESLNIL